MNTLGIFSFYNKNGEINDDIEYTLQNFSLILSNLIIVINGEIKKDSYAKLEKYTKKIIVRENTGFDSAAYKYVIQNLIRCKELYLYDEVVLCNDTFFGPFYSFDKIFSIMRKEECDFWGFSRHLGGTKRDDHVIYNHIQSYFLVFNKKLINSNVFSSFWNKLENSRNYTDAILNFEVGLSSFFHNQGFVSKAYNEVCGWKSVEKCNNYSRYCGTLISDYDFPILKKKAVKIANFVECKKALDVLNSRYLYPTINIVQLLEADSIFNPAKLKKFLDGKKRIFIYGSGQVGISIQEYFDYKKINYDGVVVTQKGPGIDQSVLEFKDLTINSDDGFVLALGKKNLYEVVDYLISLVQKNQLFIPNYDD